MSNSNHIKELYQLVGRDPHSWLAQAHGLKQAADVLRVALRNNLQQAPSAPGIQETRVALIQSFMLLTGFAFENLIKGVFIAVNPTLVQDGKFDRSTTKERSGHGFATYSAQLPGFTATPDQSDLLRRLEEYVVWAGRYLLPGKVQVYIDSTKPTNLRTLRPTDFITADQLFEELTRLLISECTKNSP